MAEWQTNDMWQAISAYTEGGTEVKPGEHDAFTGLELSKTESGLTVARRRQTPRQVGELAVTQTTIECLTEAGVGILAREEDPNPVIARINHTVEIVAVDKPSVLEIEFDKDEGVVVLGRIPLPEPPVKEILLTEWSAWGVHASISPELPDLWPHKSIENEAFTRVCLARLVLLFGPIPNADT